MLNYIVNNKYVIEPKKTTQQNNRISYLGSYVSLIGQISSEFNIFSNLPEHIYDTPRIRNFLQIFKKKISEISNQTRALTKLNASLDEEGNWSIDWMFRNLRIYFIFNANDVDSYGLLVRKQNGIGISSECDMLTEQNYEQIIDKTINLVVNNQKG